MQRARRKYLQDAVYLARGRPKKCMPTEERRIVYHVTTDVAKSARVIAKLSKVDAIVETSERTARGSLMKRF